MIKILKEAKALKNEIEKVGLTTASDVVLAQILCGINERGDRAGGRAFNFHQ